VLRARPSFVIPDTAGGACSTAPLIPSQAKAGRIDTTRRDQYTWRRLLAICSHRRWPGEAITWSGKGLFGGDEPHHRRTNRGYNELEVPSHRSTVTSHDVSSALLNGHGPPPWTMSASWQSRARSAALSASLSSHAVRISSCRVVDIENSMEDFQPEQPAQDAPKILENGRRNPLHTTFVGIRHFRFMGCKTVKDKVSSVHCWWQGKQASSRLVGLRVCRLGK